MTDIQILTSISYDHFDIPRDIAKRISKRRINATLGRLTRTGLIERIRTKTYSIVTGKQIGRAHV